jgi:hypothetical protein
MAIVGLQPLATQERILRWELTSTQEMIMGWIGVGYIAYYTHSSLE